MVVAMLFIFTSAAIAVSLQLMPSNVVLYVVLLTAVIRSVDCKSVSGSSVGTMCSTAGSSIVIIYLFRCNKRHLVKKTIIFSIMAAAVRMVLPLPCCGETLSIRYPTTALIDTSIQRRSPWLCTLVWLSTVRELLPRTGSLKPRSKALDNET